MSEDFANIGMPALHFTFKENGPLIPAAHFILIR
jgi:hypothetical protein